MTLSSEAVNRITLSLIAIIADQDVEIARLKAVPVDHSCGIVDRQITKLMNFLRDEEAHGRVRVDIDEITNFFVTDPADD